MPSYDYQCTGCNHTFEVFQSMLDEPLKECPECGKTVRRIITGGSGIIFKGSGFYVTDNKKNGSGGKKASGGTKSAEPASSSESASPSSSTDAPSKKEPVGAAGDD